MYTFFEGNWPLSHPVNFRPAIFNRAAYGELQSQAGWHTFYMVSDDEVCACMRFSLQGGVARSPLRAPFGSLDGGSHLPPKIVFAFLAFVEEQLKQAGASAIVIKNPHDLYNPQLMTLLSNFCLTHQYDVADAEVGAVIPVTGRPFAQIIHPRKKRKLQQSRTERLTFRQLDHSDLQAVYEFIAACRLEKNYRLSISLEELQRFVYSFPDDYLLFAVIHEGMMVAASVAIRVNDKALYHFISDHIRKIDVLRPALILMEGIYDYCSAAGITLLDLGTSTLQGQPDLKLLRFKTEIGGQLTNKFTFEKKLR